MGKYLLWISLPALMALSFWRTARAQETDTQQWQKLIVAKKYDDPRALCTAWLDSTNALRKAEAHKCLSNVVLSGKDNEVVVLENDDAGGAVLRSTFNESAVDQAVKHLDEALRLAPQDLSIHQGRLHLLEVSTRYEEMAKALDESCRVYRGPDGFGAWLAYPDELFEDKHYRASISLLKVLDQYFPNNHEVLGNLGAAHSMLKEDEKAIEYLRKAVELAPNDPIDTWNLGRLYDFTDKIQLADQWYQKALSLDTDAKRRRTNTCLYAKFVEKKLGDPKRACELQKANCEPKDQTACTQAK
jgi:tetratricopeptide (TPR) repeat protein